MPLSDSLCFGVPEIGAGSVKAGRALKVLLRGGEGKGASGAESVAQPTDMKGGAVLTGAVAVAAAAAAAASGPSSSSVMCGGRSQLSAFDERRKEEKQGELYEERL